MRATGKMCEGHTHTIRDFYAKNCKEISKKYWGRRVLQFELNTVLHVTNKNLIGKVIGSQYFFHGRFCMDVSMWVFLVN